MKNTAYLSLLALGISMSSTACVLNPLNNTQLPAGAESVRVGVWSPNIEGAVTHYRVFASPDGSSWRYVGRVPATIGYTEAAVSLPTSVWSTADCERTTYLQVRVNDSRDTATTFDEMAPDEARTSYDCLIETYGSGSLSEVIEAAEVCRSPDSPNIKITSPVSAPVYRGNVVLGSTSQVDAFNRSCTRRLVGNLHIPTTIRGHVTLPYLEEVEGEVRVEHPSYLDSSRFDRSYDRNLPRLRTITGNLIASLPSPVGSLQSHLNLGLPALTRVRGDVEVEIVPAEFRSTAKGLEALEVIEGDLRILPGPREFEERGFLDGLRSIQGSLFFRGGGMFFTFDRLSEVQGDVWFEATLVRPYRLFPDLNTVGGDFTIQGRPDRPSSSFAGRAQLNGARFPDNLTRVRGTVSVIYGRLPLSGSPTLNLGSSTARFGGLVLDDVEGLRDFTVVTLDPMAPVTIREMTELCRPTINARLEDMVMRGWRGTATVSEVAETCL